ncbi:MAG: transposase [Candidatus Ozemobacteraceae bacterium]
MDAVSTNLPSAAIVFDHFHVVKAMKDKISDLRRDMYREATDVLKKAVLKGTRWLLLKNPENLDDTRRERERLADALRINQPLATAYYLKEDLRQIWSQPSESHANRCLPRYNPPPL